MKNRFLAIWVIVAILFIAIGNISFGSQKPDSDNPLHIAVGILPQAYIIERIAGDNVVVDVLVGPGQSPETFDPTPKDISRLFEIDTYFQIGLSFENRLIQKISSLDEGFNAVDTRQGITLRTISDHNHGEFVHQGEPDPHIWLDPQLLKIQARTVCRELSRLRPLKATVFEANLNDLENDLNRVDSMVADMLAPLAESGFFVFHPSYGYFADRYGLRQVAVETEGKDPGARHLTELINQARSENISAIFVQPQFSTNTAEAVAREIGCRIVQIDPLARNCVDNLTAIARSIRDAMMENSGDTD